MPPNTGCHLSLLFLREKLPLLGQRGGAYLRRLGGHNAPGAVLLGDHQDHTNAPWEWLGLITSKFPGDVHHRNIRPHKPDLRRSTLYFASPVRGGMNCGESFLDVFTSFPEGTMDVDKLRIFRK